MNIDMTSDKWDVTEFLDGIAGQPWVTRRQLVMEARAQLQQQANYIRAQVDAAKTKKLETNEYSSPDWWRRANAALRVKGYQMMRLQDALSAINQESKANVSHNQQEDRRRYERCFIMAAKQLLTGEQFSRIAATAQEMLDETTEENTDGHVVLVSGS